MELCELKHHICNGRHFEAGVGLGGLINSLLNRQDILEEDEEVQDKDEDEECEESSEEEDHQEPAPLRQFLYLKIITHRAINKSEEN